MLSFQLEFNCVTTSTTNKEEIKSATSQSKYEKVTLQAQAHTIPCFEQKLLLTN
jgi:hypothetical protein